MSFTALSEGLNAAFEEAVYEVYLALLLLWRGMDFEDGTDADRVLEGIELGGLLYDFLPCFEGSASLISVGEDEDLVVYQGCQ